jgi:hypothetical protein
MNKHSNLLFAILTFSFVLIGSACNRSDEMGEIVEEDQPSAEETISPFRNMGVELGYDDTLAGIESVQWLSAAEIPGQHDWMGSAPFIRIDFVSPSGVVYISRVGDQQQVSDFSQKTLIELNRIIQEKSRSIEGCVPVLPYATFFTFCDHQEFKSNLDYIDFNGGEGIRFITAYAVQQYVPINNETIEYSYQALSNDKQYYLSGHFKIRNEILSESDWGVPEDMFEDILGEDFLIYAQLKLDQLENNPLLYSPSINSLDALMKSFSLEETGR